MLFSSLLDYETINPAIPLFNGTSPYHIIPFQFSLHIQKIKGGKLKHVEFLYTEQDDPRQILIESLLKNIEGGVPEANREGYR